MTAYALVRDGELVPGTLAENRVDAWSLGFRVVTNALGHEWGSKYYKRWSESQRAAARRGFKVVKVAVVLK